MLLRSSGALRGRLPRIGRLPRLALIGACLLLALQSALDAPAASPASGADAARVVVAARDLPAGRTLVPADLRVARWPRPLVPDGSRTGPATLVGRRLIAPLRRGEPVTSIRLLGRDLARGLPAGLVVQPVTVDDPHVAELVHPGDAVDLVATPRPADFAETASAAGATVATVATAAPVLAVFAASYTSPAEVVLAVERTVALRITRDRPTQQFTVLDDPP
jgi:pilus assembly protein CpaB